MAEMIEMSGVGDKAEIDAIGGYVSDNTTFVPLLYIQQFANDPDYIVVVAEVCRPGVQWFTTKLEYTLFPPSIPESNKNFNFGVYKWPKCSDMPFVVILFPSIVKDEAAKIAEECDLRFADGVPTIFGDNTMEHFPINGPSVYKLENLPGSKVYLNALNPDGGFDAYKQRMQKLFDEERERVEAFLASMGEKEETNAGSNEPESSDGN